MGNSLFGIGVSGLQAAQASLYTTSHNIANASTPGYSRQQVNLTSSTPLLTGAGFLGTGVQVDTISRSYSAFLTTQLTQAQSLEAELDTYYVQLQQIDNLLADPDAGLAPALEDFFAGVQDVATNPANTASRQALLSASAALVARFQSLDARFNELRQGVDDQIRSTVTSINAYATSIAQLNQSIVLAQGASGGQPPNDLLDQRDALVADLNTLVGATVTVQDDGSYNVFVGSGQPLVVGTQAYSLVAMQDPEDASRTTVGYRTGASVIQLPEDSISGGQLGGLLAFRSESLDPAQNALGRVAVGLALTFNEQHRLGQDQNGDLGEDFFTITPPQVTASTRNTGSAVLEATYADANQLTTSDYRLSFDGTNYTLTRLSDDVAQTFATLPQTIDGFTLSLTGGTPAAGDSFLIQPTRSGASGIDLALSDPAKIAAAAPIRTGSGAANTGTGVISAGTVDGPAPPDANLQQPVTITFTSAGTFDVSGTGTGDPGGLSYVPGADLSFNGWTVQITGSPAAGDTFTIGPNTGGSGDNRNALLLADLSTQNLLANGTATYQSAYAALVGEVGSKTRELQITAEAQTKFVEQSMQAQQSVSGVNLDEEAANLLRYQQAYQASSKTLQIAMEVFDTLLDLGRR